jgi:hypothetical protein
MLRRQRWRREEFSRSEWLDSVRRSSVCVSVGVQCLRWRKWRKGRKRVACRRGGGGGQEKEVGAKLDLKIFREVQHQP